MINKERIVVSESNKKAIFWSVVEKFAKKGISFITSIFLARILTPDDFGMLAMATIFYGWVEIFMDFGMGQAIIQKNDATEAQISTIFWINLMMGACIYLLFFFAAPFIAQFFNHPILTSIIRISSFGFIMSGFGMVQGSILVKQLNYRFFFYASLVRIIIFGIAGITLGVLGYGVFSLVWAGIISSIFGNITIWYMSDWRPKLLFKLKETKQMFILGTHFMGFGLINNIFDSLDVLMFSKIYNPQTLGHYNRAIGLRDLPLGMFILPITRPLFPIFSQYQDDMKKIREVFYHYLGMLEFVSFAVAGLMWLSARELIVILYSDQWLQSAEYFLFAIWIVPLEPNKVIITSLLKGLGQVKLLIKLNFFERGIIVIALAVGYFYGIESFLVTYISLRFCTLMQRIYYVSRVAGLSIWMQLKPLVTNVIVLVLPILALQFVKFDSLWLSMILKSLGFVLSYVLLAHLLNLEGYHTALAQAKKMIGGYFEKRRNKQINAN